MNKMFALLSGVAALALVSPAIAADKESFKSEVKVERDAKGNYEKTTSEKQKDASGKASHETKVEQDVGRDGSVEKTITDEKVVNPKDGDKTKVKTKIESKTKDGVTTTQTTKKVNGDTVVDTKTETPAAH